MIIIKRFIKRTAKTYILYRVGKWLNYEPAIGNRKVKRRYLKPFLRRIK